MALKTMKTAAFLLLFAPITVAAVLSISCARTDEPVNGKRLNLIIISMDTLRADHLGCYGYSRNTSPNIDRFAAESTLFQNSFANSNWTLPSHMSLMTSLYPAEHGVLEKSNRLSPRIPTLAEVLKGEGYRTAAFTAGYFVDRKFGFDRGFEMYNQRYDVERQNVGQGWRLEHLEKDLFSWLDAHRAEDFFLFVHSYDVHQPLIAHDYLEEFSPSYDGWLTNLHNMQTFTASPDFNTFKAISGEDDFNINLFVQKIINRNLIDLNEADRQHLIALYDNEIRYADEYFRHLREKLEDLGLWDNTVIVFWSDHGEELFERGGVRHSGPRLYEEILRVPLIVRIPGVEPTAMSNLAQSIDIAPSALEILGIPPQESFAGRSLFNADSRNSYVIAQGTGCECVRTDRMKLIFRRRGRIAELYDLEQDPNEKANVAEERPYQVEELRSKLYEATNRLVPDGHMQKQLRALGYVD